MYNNDIFLIVRSLRELDFRQLMDVYEQSNRQAGQENYPNLSEPQQLLMAEQDVYTYLKECFFKDPNACYAVWAPEGHYKAAVRLEPYRDGYLLTCLETAPESRRKGYGSNLLKAVILFLSEKGCSKLYAHIDKRNTASLAVHAACGFRKAADYAVLLDGSVFHTYDTYCCILKKYAR